MRHKLIKARTVPGKYILLKGEKESRIYDEKSFPNLTPPLESSQRHHCVPKPAQNVTVCCSEPRGNVKEIKDIPLFPGDFFLVAECGQL